MEKSRRSGFEDQWGGGDWIAVVNREASAAGTVSGALVAAKREDARQVTSPEPAAGGAHRCSVMVAVITTPILSPCYPVSVSQEPPGQGCAQNGQAAQVPDRLDSRVRVPPGSEHGGTNCPSLR